MIRQLGSLVTIVLLAWLAMVIPARWAWGDEAVLPGAVALALCLAPAALTLAWANWAAEQPAEQKMLVVLGGTGARMFFVLAAALVLYFTVPALNGDAFWIWLVVCYLLTLAVEVALIVSSARRAETGSIKQAD